MQCWCNSDEGDGLDPVQFFELFKKFLSGYMHNKPKSNLP